MSQGTAIIPTNTGLAAWEAWLLDGATPLEFQEHASSAQIHNYDQLGKSEAAKAQ